MIECWIFHQPLLASHLLFKLLSFYRNLKADKNSHITNLTAYFSNIVLNFSNAYPYFWEYTLLSPWSFEEKMHLIQQNFLCLFFDHHHLRHQVFGSSFDMIISLKNLFILYHFNHLKSHSDMNCQIWNGMSSPHHLFHQWITNCWSNLDYSTCPGSIHQLQRFTTAMIQ